MSVEDIYSQFLRGNVAESAASTFTAGAAILTGASVNRVGGKMIGMEIHAIGVESSKPQDLPSTGNREYVAFALSTRSDLTAMPGINEDHVVYKNQVSIDAGVGTYLPLLEDRDSPMPRYMEFKSPLLVAHDKLYPYILSTNSSAAASVAFWILFTYVLMDDAIAIEALEAFR
jgi:hypothetical protein